MSEMTREPVTTTVSVDSACPPADAGCAWAQTGALNRQASSASTDTLVYESRSMASSPSVSQCLISREMETAPCAATSPEKPVPWSINCSASGTVYEPLTGLLLTWAN